MPIARVPSGAASVGRSSSSRSYESGGRCPPPAPAGMARLFSRCVRQAALCVRVSRRGIMSGRWRCGFAPTDGVNPVYQVTDTINNSST